MKLSSKAWVILLATSLGGGAIACNSGGGGGGSGGSGEGGSGDTKTGGKGGGTGTKTGGTAGGKTGGTGGGKTGGTSGSTTGGTGGGTGGVSGGTGGTAPGGAGGTSKTGGTGGTTPVATAGVPIFSGKTMTFEKLVAGDAGPGYAYVTAGGTAGVVNVVAVDDPALPAGTKFALESVNPKIDPFANVIFGFNFRQNESAMQWNWFDASGFKGFRYWAKVEFPAVPTLPGGSFNNILYAAGQWPVAPTDPTSMKGTCTDPTGVVCEPNISKPMVITKAPWKKYTVAFDDMMAATAVEGLDFKKVGRVDMLHSSSGAAVTLSITGIELVTAAQLLE
jgi:hypothetical protein